jgi:hypothetical protein
MEMIECEERICIPPAGESKNPGNIAALPVRGAINLGCSDPTTERGSP